MPVTVRLFRRSYNDTVDVHEELIGNVQDVLTQVLNFNSRTTGDLFDVVPGTVTIEPFGDSNDNLQVAIIPFAAVVNQCFT